MKVSSVTPEGYQCKCGRVNKFPGYVYAHWNISLVHTCECGEKYTILRGIATRLSDVPPPETSEELAADIADDNDGVYFALLEELR